jgi:hypoxanthine phosphoribosyltransferase
MQMVDNHIVRAHDKSFSLMISREEIARRVKEIGLQLSVDYRDKNPLMLAILNGAFIFAADLVRASDMNLEITFVKLASYSGTATTGNVQTVLGLDKALKGRHIIIVEDIIDTGNTLANFLTALVKDEPASVAIAACLFKKDALQHPLSIDYYCFEIPNEFVVGYGLDYDGAGRQFDSVYTLINQ